MSIKTICARIGALALIGGLAACGTAGGSAAPAVAPVVTQTVAPAPAVTVTASPPQVIINNNNNPAPAPTQTVYAPAPVYAQADPWSVVVRYVNDVNDGNASDAWSIFGPVEQASWNNNYSTFAAWVSQTLVNNTSEVSESGDTVTTTFNLSNSAGTNVPYIATFTVDNGIIISCTSSQN